MCLSWEADLRYAAESGGVFCRRVTKGCTSHKTHQKTPPTHSHTTPPQPPHNPRRARRDVVLPARSDVERAELLLTGRRIDGNEPIDTEQVESIVLKLPD